MSQRRTPRIAPAGAGHLSAGGRAPRLAAVRRATPRRALRHRAVRTLAAASTVALACALPGGLCDGARRAVRAEEPLVAAAAAAPTAEQLDFFEKRIRPVLADHCYACHSAETPSPKGGLRVDSRAWIRRGGESGPAVVPGEVDESLLISAMRHESFEMPPESKLADDVIDDFVRWVTDGAADPRDEPAIDSPSAAEADARATSGPLWSTEPVRRPMLPDVVDRAWPRDDLDRFILSRLEDAGLAPVADASRRVLLRRLSFDLTGLPPTAAEIEAFENDPSPAAVEKVVDRLLASPHFGERWGRHWLDVARYADSAGGGRTTIFETAWRYRDWVVDSFNRDRPYDQFIVDQIAGDLLARDVLEGRATGGATTGEVAAEGDLPAEVLAAQSERFTATGFLAIGPKNLDGQDKELLRMDVVDEQIDTIGRVFLGLSIGCARCHDHKFDPLPTADYYALAAILRSTQTLVTANVSIPVTTPLPLPREAAQRLARHDRRVAELEAELKRGRTRLNQLSSALVSQGVVVDDRDATLLGSWSRSTHSPNYVGEGYLHDNDREKGQNEAHFVPDLPGAGMYEVRVAYNHGPSRAGSVPVSIEHAEGTTTRKLDQRQRPTVGGLFEPLGRFRFESGRAARVTIGTAETKGHVIVDAVQFVPVDQLPATADDAADGAAADDADAGAEDRAAAADAQASGRAPDTVAAQLAALSDEVASLERQLTQLRRDAPPRPPAVLSVVDEREPGDYFILVRGNVHQPGAAVTRGFLSAFGGGPAGDIADGESGRRELAAWLARPEHPLTARVMVNRVWQHLLGVGLVETADNFGATGQPPTHPELLDHLAAEFVGDGWSVKRLIRRIVLSRTYQLASTDDEAARGIDPENRLWWRAHRKRLEAEPLRDAMLAFSGRLDRTLGGASVRPGTREEFHYEYAGTRRTLYLPVFRAALYELLEVFDFPDPNLVVGRRARTTLPAQALLLMNSPFVMEEAQHAALWLLERESCDEQRLEAAYLAAVGRPPTEAERHRVADFLSASEAALPQSTLAQQVVPQPAQEADRAADLHHRQLEAWTAVCQVLMASLDFRYLE